MMIYCHFKSIGFAQKRGASVHASLSKATEKNASRLLLEISSNVEEHAAAGNNLFTELAQVMRNGASFWA